MRCPASIPAHRPPRLTWCAALLAVLMVLAIGRAALAQNSIYIDAGSTGSVRSLAIVQDAATGTASNTVGGTSGTGTPFTVTGAWHDVALSQTGARNTLQGSLTAAASASSNDFGATFTGGGNIITILAYSDTGGGGTSFQVASAGNSTAQYGVYSNVAGSSVSTTINSVAGGGVYVQQTGSGAVGLTVNGGGYTLGPAANAVPTPFATFFAGTGPGVAVYQSAATPLNATVTATSNGYGATIVHGP